MAKGKPVAEFGEHMPCTFGSVGMRNSVVEMDFDFAPASVAMVGKHIEQAFVILLRGIEIGVNQRLAIVVSPSVDYFRIFARPPFQTAFLFWPRSALLTIFGYDAWFEMIGQGDDQMHRVAGRRFQGAPSRRWQHFSGIGNLLLKTHVSFRCPAPKGASNSKNDGIAKAIP